MSAHLNLKPGDVVRLKSGGLDMTVVRADSALVSCEWLDAEGRPQSASWSAVAVEKADPSNFNRSVATGDPVQPERH